MHVLLIQNTLYLPSFGGASKANRIMLEQLAARGHRCRALALADSGQGWLDPAWLAERRVTWRDEPATGGVRFEYEGVHVRAVPNTPALRAAIAGELTEARPDVVLVSSEDPGQQLLEQVLNDGRSRVVYLAHTPMLLPFGPSAFIVSARSTEVIRRAHGVISCGNDLRDYIQRWGGISAVVLPSLFYGPGPFPNLASRESPFVTFINPCLVKGLPIFLELAAQMPDVAFATIPTWGTTPEDRARLAALPNVTCLEPREDLCDILRQTRALVAPSVWDEGLPRVPIEAMMHGVPVMASNVPGSREAMLGVEYVLPVRPLAGYQQRLDEQMMPIPNIPPQDIGPWRATLRHLLEDEATYTRVSTESHAAAARFLASIRVSDVEEYLLGVIAAPDHVAPASVPDGDDVVPPVRLTTADRLALLTPERRAVLARRLTARRNAAPRS